MRLLSVIIPSFNVELYLARCLDSLLYNKDVVEFLDIIVVNDGSKDNTASVAEKYRQLYPKNITVITKKNGGHGSTINAGLKVAKGKYIKVIDADDWVNIFDFSDFVQKLNEVDDDIIITDYQRDILYDSSIVEFAFYQQDKSQKIEATQKLVDEEDFFFMFSMHSMTVKTNSLKKVWGEGLLEHTFYVDQQYVAKALLCAKTFRTLDYNIYRYFIGRPEQSVSFEGFFRHRQDHERVLRWLLTMLQSDDVQNSEHLTAVITKQVKAMVATHYEIYYTTIAATTPEIAELFEFDNYLMEVCPSLHREIPAAQNVRKRLSPMRRAVKRRLLDR